MNHTSGGVTFPEMTVETQIFKYSQTVAIMLLMCGTISVLGNGFVLYVFYRTEPMRKQTANLFLINQSVIDGTAGAILLANTTLDSLPEWVIRRPILYELYCRLWLSKVFMWSLFTASTYNIVAVTVERFACIMFPIAHRTYVTRRALLAVMVCEWLFGFAFSASYIISSSGVVCGRCMLYSLYPSLMVQRYVGLLIVTVQYVFPLTVVTVCYAAIFKRLTRSRPSGRNPMRQNSASVRVRRNVVKTLMTVSVCFVICWTPNQAYYMAHNFGLRVEFESTVYNLSVVMVLVNCCCNPLVYSLTYSRFQEAVVDIFTSKRSVYENQQHHQNAPNSTDTPTTMPTATVSSTTCNSP